MKKVLPIVILLVLQLFLPKPAAAITRDFWSDTLSQNIVYNPFQGLGICHWSSPTILADPIVSWSYESANGVTWADVEPVEGQFNWQAIDSLIALHQRNGKKLWLQIYNAQGLSPQWVKDKVFPDGKKIQFMGTINDPQNPDPCSTMLQNVPLLWDRNYLAVWKNVIHALAQKYDNNPTVEAIVTMAGGGYGEMAVCSTCGPAKCWAKAAGCCTDASDATCTQCADQKFSSAVNDMIDLYLDEFINKPVILQLGAGAYQHTNAVINPVVDYLIPKYGMRVLLKFNGWECSDPKPTPVYCGQLSGGCDLGHSGGSTRVYLDNEQTKYGLEPGHPSADKRTSEIMMNCRPMSSYACLQSFYWEGDRALNWQTMRSDLAKSLGSRVALKEATYPQQATAGQSYSISLVLKNLGQIPPFRPKRVGIKDEAASYQITYQLLGFENKKWYFELPVSSKTWTSGNEYTISHNMSLPADLVNGSYDLAVALYDPEAAIRSRQEYFRFLNQDLLDSEGRAVVGTVMIAGGPTEPPSARDGDLDNNNVVDGDDRTILLRNWAPSGPVPTPAAGQSSSDLNADNRVDERDLTVLLSNWGN